MKTKKNHKTVLFKCPVCYRPSWGNSAKRYCSRRCQMVSFFNRHPGWAKEHGLKYRLKQTKPCQRCEKPIKFQLGLFRTFCSSTCRERNHRESYLASFRRTYDAYAKFKEREGCKQCGYNRCGACLDFHHVKPGHKERRITAALWKSKSRLYRREIKKCILLCKNCHYERHKNGDIQ